MVVSGPAPLGGDSEKKGDRTGRLLALGSEQVKPQTGSPKLGTLCAGGERSILMAAASPCSSVKAERMPHPCSLHATALHWIWGGQNLGTDSTQKCRGDLGEQSTAQVGRQQPLLVLT